MKQPIKPGKLINNRYLVELVLGQGRFSRTYLTEDTHRFHEACVVKEFAPQIQDPVVLQKTTELFQRQAEILYTIYHPQVANFREFFRLTQDNQTSLFLVQDYVEGETYQNLLNLRRSQGKTFTEAEVSFLLQQLLPVVQYLHEQGIVHRDICPQNIIQREFDQLPVLIDFSSVKEINAITDEESNQPPDNQQPTTAWVLNQFNKISHSSPAKSFSETASLQEDLYGLGTTAIVLLTGKEISTSADSPQQVIEHLQQCSVSAELAEILSKLVTESSAAPFLSAQEVLDRLTVVADKLAESPSAEIQAETIGKNRSVTASTSDSVPSVDLKNAMAVKSSSSKTVLWGCIGKLSLFLVLILGSGTMGWFAGKAWLDQVLRPKPLPSSDILTSSQPSASPSPISTVNNGKMTDALRTRLQSLGIDPVFFNRLVEQSLTLRSTNNQTNSSPSPSQDEQWQQAANALLDKLSSLSPEALQELGRYTATQRNDWVRQVNQLRLSSRSLTNLVNMRFFKDFPELESQNFQGQPLEQVWYAIAFDTVKALQQNQNYELLVRDSNQNTNQVTGKLAPGEGKAYVIFLPASKPMEIKLEGDPDALLTIYSPTGQQTLLDNSRTHQWSGVLPETGYYEIIVTSKAKAPFDYQLTLSVW